MNFVFESKVAQVVGVDGAIMMQNIGYWIAKNKANNKHYYDENYWTYNSLPAFEKLFPFWSQKQIYRILKKLIDDGYLISGNYNKQNYDRTKWYAITQKGISIIPNGQMDNTKESDGNDQKVAPIPNNKPYSKPIYIYTSNDVEDIWNIYPNKKGKAQAIKKIPKILEKHGKENITRCIERYGTEVKGKDIQFILNGSTFFNGRFEDYLDDNYKLTQVIDINKKNIKEKPIQIDESKLGAI